MTKDAIHLRILHLQFMYVWGPHFREELNTYRTFYLTHKGNMDDLVHTLLDQTENENGIAAIDLLDMFELTPEDLKEEIIQILNEGREDYDN